MGKVAAGRPNGCTGVSGISNLSRMGLGTFCTIFRFLQSRLPQIFACPRISGNANQSIPSRLFIPFLLHNLESKASHRPIQSNSPKNHVFSATDIASFLACHHLSTLERVKTRGEIRKPYFKDPSVELLRELGIRHEPQYLKHLSDTLVHCIISK